MNSASGEGGSHLCGASPGEPETEPGVEQLRDWSRQGRGRRRRKRRRRRRTTTPPGGRLPRSEEQEQLCRYSSGRWCCGHSSVTMRMDEDRGLAMDEWTIKTPNPICRLFFKIDLLTDFAALCLTDFIDWRYIQSWLVFSTQLVNCCPHGQRNYTCVLLPLYLLSDLLPPSQTKCTVYTDSLCLGGEGGCWIVR